MTLLDRTLALIRPLDTDAAARARRRQDGLVKPQGSLGVVEAVGVQLAGLAGRCPPPVPEPAALAIFAGDHGVLQRGVSPWPREITAAMVSTFLSGKAVISALARQAGVGVQVVDVGVATPLESAPGLLDRRIRAGTHDLSTTAAMSRDEATAALETGIEVAQELVDGGARCLLTGDMGIGNTTPSAALIAAFTGLPATDVTGRGTGIDDDTWQRKAGIVDAALRLHRPDSRDPLAVLSALGGFEHAATAGFLLGAAAGRVPVVLDGVLAAAAALVAEALAPDVTGALVAGHLSVEPGAGQALSKLGLRPLLDLDLRLGEGSGAVLALPIVQSAARVLHEVAQLSELTQPASAPSAGERTLVLGGARSGKSVTAESLFEGAAAVTYVATGALPSADDPEWAERVRLHRERRPAHWTTLETRELVPLLAAEADEADEPLVIDCLSTWLAATMDDCGVWTGEPLDAVNARIDALVEAWATSRRRVVAISNEVGSGVVPATSSGRLYRDLLGILNARIAAASDEVLLVTAGITQRLR
ncbi:nicotinate-nucleotide--dimethylbenzimidazole phosphoribosyltransferase [Flindersiella endophytica]